MKKLKLALFFALILTLLIALPACKTKTLSITNLVNRNEFSTTSSNSVIHQAQTDAPEDTLLYIIFDPTEDELAELLSYQVLKIDSEAPTTLLAPCEQNCNLTIYNLIYNEEKAKYERGTEVWNLESSSKGLILAAQLDYGETEQPTYELYVESGENYGSYLFELPAEPDTLPHLDYLVKQGTIVTVRGLD